MGRSLAKRFGNVIRAHRRQKGMSQQTLAFEANLDRTYISILERGVAQPTLGTIFRLADSLGTTPQTLLGQVSEIDGGAHEDTNPKGMSNEQE